MIKNSSLGDILNDYKDNEDQSNTDYSSNSIFTAIGTIVTGILFVIKVLAYGFGFKIIFHTDWSILNTIIIGLAFNFLLNYIYDLIHNKSDNLNL